jgi:uncharacterized protein involved in exopolysaccharide biosynthesis
MAEQNTTEQFDNDEISLKELILKIKEWYQFLLTKCKLIVLAGIIGGLIGFTYAYFQKPTYKAVLTFAMEDEKNIGSGLTGALGLASTLGIDLGGSAGGAFNVSNLLELFKSRKIIEKTLLNPILDGEKSQSLAQYYINLKKINKNWYKNPDLKKIKFPINADRNKFTLQQDSILGKLYYNFIEKDKWTSLLKIYQKDKKVSIFTIESNTIDELFSKVFVENLAKEVSRYYIELKSKKAKQNVEILQKQTDSIRNELNIAISDVAKSSDNVFNLNQALNIKRSPGTRKQVDVQANTAILTQLVINLEMAKVALRKETPLIQIIDVPILPLEKNKLEKMIATILGFFVTTLLMILFLISKYKLISAIRN